MRAIKVRYLIIVTESNKDISKNIKLTLTYCICLLYIATKTPWIREKSQGVNLGER